MSDDPKIHRLREAKTGRSVRHERPEAEATGRLDQAGGEAGLADVDDDLQVGHEDALTHGRDAEASSEADPAAG
jgi:hypothetical protein